MEDDRPTIPSQGEPLNLGYHQLEGVGKMFQPLDMPYTPYDNRGWLGYNCYRSDNNSVIQGQGQPSEESIDQDPVPDQDYRAPYLDCQSPCQDWDSCHAEQRRITEQPHPGLQRLLERAEESASKCTSPYLEDGRMNPLLAPFQDRGKADEEAKPEWTWCITLQRWYREDKVTNTRIFLPPNPMMRVYRLIPGPVTRTSDA